jgi:hypothetical protein
MVKEYKKGNVNNNNKLGDKKEDRGRVGAAWKDRDHRS